MNLLPMLCSKHVPVVYSSKKQLSLFKKLVAAFAGQEQLLALFASNDQLKGVVDLELLPANRPGT